MPADGSRVQLYYAEEVDGWGVDPVSPPTMKELRFTGDTPLRHNKSTVQSQEIRSDRQVPDVVETAAGAQGGFNFELSYAAFDDFLNAVLEADTAAANPSVSWDTAISETTVNVDKTGAASGKVRFTKTGLGTLFGNSVTPKWGVGQMIKVSGTTDTDASGFKRITAVVDANTIEVDDVGNLVAGDETGTATVKGSMARNGVTETSFILEKLFSDSPGPTDVTVIKYNGMVPGQMDLNVTAEQILTGSMEFLGKRGLAAEAADYLTASVGNAIGAAPTNDVMNATAHVGNIYVGGYAAANILQCAVRSIQITINNNLRAQNVVGERYACGIGHGRAVVTGRIEVYFTDKTLFEAFENHDASSIQFSVTDPAGNTYYFTIPRLRWTDSQEPAQGDTDVIQTLAFQSVRDPDTDCEIQIDRFAA